MAECRALMAGVDVTKAECTKLMSNASSPAKLPSAADVAAGPEEAAEAELAVRCGDGEADGGGSDGEADGGGGEGEADGGVARGRVDTSPAANASNSDGRHGGGGVCGGRGR